MECWRPTAKKARRHEDTAPIRTATSPSARSASASGRPRPAGGARRATTKRSRCCATRATSASRSSMPPTRTATGAAKSNWPKPSAAAASSVVYATKFGYDFYHAERPTRRGQAELPHDFSPEFVRYALEASLRRLRDRLRRHLSDAQRAHGANRRRRALGAARVVQARGQNPHVRRRARAGDRLALRRRRGRAQRGTSRRLQIIWNMLEQFPGRRADSTRPTTPAPTPAT